MATTGKDLFAELQEEDRAYQQKMKQKYANASSVATFATISCNPLHAASSTDTSTTIPTADLVYAVLDPKEIPAASLALDPVVTAKSKEESQADSLRKRVYALDAENLTDRRKAIEYFLGTANSNEISTDELDGIFAHCVKSLLLRFSDANERNRDTAIRALLQFVDRGVNVSPVVALVVATLHLRIKTNPEPSEEVRLLLLLVLSRMIALCGQALAAHIVPVCEILQAVVEDPHPEVRKEMCHSIILLCSCLPQHIKKISRNIDVAIDYSIIISNFISNFDQVLEAIFGSQAVGALLICGGSSEIADLVAWQEPNVIPVADFFHNANRTPHINYFGLLCVDGNAAVRRAFMEMIIDCLTRMADRWDHYSRLFPYLLNAIADENSSMATEAFEGLEQVGIATEKEKEEELRDTRAYGIQAPNERNCDERWRTRKHIHPLERRPRLGARLVIREQFHRIIGTIVLELNEWKTTVRLHSIKLLYIIMCYTEGHITGHLPAIVSGLTRVLSDVWSDNLNAEGVRLCTYALSCAEIIGEFGQVKAALEAILPMMCNPPPMSYPRQASIWRSSHLAILAGFIRGCSEDRLTGVVSEIMGALAKLSNDADSDLETNMQMAACLYQLCGIISEEKDLLAATRVWLNIVTHMMVNGHILPTSLEPIELPIILAQNQSDVSPWAMVGNVVKAAAVFECPQSINRIISQHLPDLTIFRIGFYYGAIEFAGHQLSNVDDIAAFLANILTNEHELISKHGLMTLRAVEALTIHDLCSTISISSITTLILAVLTRIKMSLQIATDTPTQIKSWVPHLELSTSILSKLVEVFSNRHEADTEVSGEQIMDELIQICERLSPFYDAKVRVMMWKNARVLMGYLGGPRDAEKLSNFAVRKLHDADKDICTESLQLLRACWGKHKTPAILQIARDAAEIAKKNDLFPQNLVDELNCALEQHLNLT